MCLAVYIGATHPLPIADVEPGELGIEKAAWTPPPLSKMAHIYYAGRKGDAAAMECSCLLHEYVVWSDQPPAIVSDDLYPKIGPCPFEVLRRYCEHVLDQDGFVVIACDDSGGVEQKASDDDYEHAYLFVHEIRRGRLIFASSRSDFPARALTVLRASEVQLNPLIEQD